MDSMDQVLDFFRKLFDASDWPPHWQSGNWTSFHGWLYIISDLLIWSAYFAIPLAILKYLSGRTNSRFFKTYLLFAVFILACGTTYLLDAISFWFPVYRFHTVVKLITGILSWITVIHLIKLLPIASSFRPYNELEREINEKKGIEEELKTANEQLLIAQEIAKIGHWQWDIINNKVTWSKELFKIFDLPETQQDLSYDFFISRVHPEDREKMNETIREAMITKLYKPLIHRIVLSNGKEKVVLGSGEVISDENGNVIKMIGIGQDITEQQRSQQQLLERTRELEMSNAELKKFAYIASHDLQEPLRKIMTFSSLLEKEITHPEDKVKLYLGKIFMAPGRMQRLIEDILRFSNLKSEQAAFEKTDMNRVVSQVISDLEVQVDESHAKITIEKLPAIEAIPGQMRQLVQNLIANALKFRREQVETEIQIKGRIIEYRELQEQLHLSFEEIPFLGREKVHFLELKVCDNGIGFEDKYSSKIFEIFQRLHSHSYPGTGIGLAICKRIVENHHGLIRAESTPGQGSCFTIYLPLIQPLT